MISTARMALGLTLTACGPGIPDARSHLAECGNGIVEGREDCDDADESSACNVDCSFSVCGDGIVNASAAEQCDGADVLGASCASEGFAGGTLVCSAGCMLDLGACSMLSISPIKKFDFTWAAAAEADYYRLLESPALGEPFAPLGVDIPSQSVSHPMPLHLRGQARYRLRACDSDVDVCMDWAEVEVSESLAEAVGYFKASNTAPQDEFGSSMALSKDGTTLVVGAPLEDSSDALGDSGAVYVYTQGDKAQWSFQARIEAANADEHDQFGASVALSADGNTLAVGAPYEDSNASGVGGDQGNDGMEDAGAVYIYTRDPQGRWSPRTYIKATVPAVLDIFGAGVALSGDGNTLAVATPWKDDGGPNAGAVYVYGRDEEDGWSREDLVRAPNPSADDTFGTSVALSEDGGTLAVGAYLESSDEVGIGGDGSNDDSQYAGAAYVYRRSGSGQWPLEVYVKATNADAGDGFGRSVALSADGSTLAVGTELEDGDGIDPTDDSLNESGAVYVYVRDELGTWSSQAYVKASNPDAVDYFGWSLALSADGNLLAVGAPGEGGSASGIDGDQTDNEAPSAGAVYVYERHGAGWSLRSYVKASNTDSGDEFGRGVALGRDGETLAVSAPREQSTATEVGGDQRDNSASRAGAVYLY